MSPEGAEVWSTIAQRELFGGWRRWVSFALIWVWSCVAGTLSQQPYVMDSLATALSFGNSIVLLFCVCALVCVLAVGSRIATACGSKHYIGVGSALLVLGSMCLLASVVGRSFVLYVCGAACGGLSIGVLKVAWGEMYSLMPLKQSMVSMGYALVASSGFVLLTQSLPPAALAAIALTAAVPLGYVLYTGAQQIGPGTGFAPQAPSRVTAWAIAIPALVGLTYGVFKAGAPLVPQGGFLAFDIATAGLWANLLAGIGFLVYSRFLGQAITPTRIVVSDMAIIVAGLLLLAAPHASTGIAAFVHELGFSLFYFFMIVYWGDLAQRIHAPVIPVYTAGYLAMMAAQLVGGTLGQLTGQGFAGSGDMTLTYMLVFAFFLCVCVMLGTSADTPLRTWASQKNAEDKTISGRCEHLADEHALTPREREVLNILARGRNASHIAEELVISQDTAKSHMRNIYRKLDVHTQQELLDLVEGGTR